MCPIASKVSELMSRYLPVILSTSLALGFSACETPRTVTTTTTRRTTEGRSNVSPDHERVVEDTTEPAPKVKTERVTATTDTPPANVEPAVTPMPTPVVQDYPTASSVDGKPGFVKSPFGGAGIVDVRGYPPGTEVKDPYTGKVFLVP